MVVLTTMLKKLPEEFRKGCSTTLERISIAIFIKTISRQVIRLWRKVIIELWEMDMAITGKNERLLRYF